MQLFLLAYFSFLIIFIIEEYNLRIRVYSYLDNNLSSGLIYSNAINLFSRGFVFISNPIFAFLIDRGGIKESYLLLISIAPLISTLICSIFNKFIIKIIDFILKILRFKYRFSIAKSSFNLFNFNFNYLICANLIAYVLFFGSFPIIYFLASTYIDNRAFLITLSPLFTSIYSIVLCFINDKKFLSENCNYKAMYTGRFVSALINPIIVYGFLIFV